MESWERHITPGVVLYASFPDSLTSSEMLLRRIRQVAEYEFFGLIEIGSVSSPDVQRDVRESCRAAGLRVGLSGGIRMLKEGSDLGSPDSSLRERSLDTGRFLVDEAVTVGAEACMLISGPFVSEPKMQQTHLAYLEESLIRICEYAQRAAGKGLMITLESFDQVGHRQRLVGPTQMAADLATRVTETGANFGLTLDMSHIPQLREELATAVAMAGRTLRQAHVANCLLQDRSHPLWGDWHPRFGFPGSEFGPSDVTRFIQSVIAHGYANLSWPGGPPGISIEVRPAPGEDPDLVFMGSLRVLRQSLAHVQFDPGTWR